MGPIDPGTHRPLASMGTWIRNRDLTSIKTQTKQDKPLKMWLSKITSCQYNEPLAFPEQGTRSKEHNTIELTFVSVAALPASCGKRNGHKKTNTAFIKRQVLSAEYKSSVAVVNIAEIAFFFIYYTILKSRKIPLFPLDWTKRQAKASLLNIYISYK